MTLRVATWNVNSLNVRLPRLLDWLAANAPDIVGLQETKLEDGKFPVMELAAAGYALQFCGQRTYNGVALLSRTTGTEVVAALPDHDDVQKRVLAATIDGVRVVCLYVPNGQAVGSEKYRYKLDWLAAATRYLRREFEQHPQLAVIGDFNVAPEDRDVHDPDLWRDQIMCSGARARDVQRLAGAGPRRRVSPVRPAAEDVQLVGLPPARVSEESRPAGSITCCCRRRWPRCAPDAGSTARRARARSLPITRR